MLTKETANTYLLWIDQTGAETLIYHTKPSTANIAQPMRLSSN
jgi:hypothetical protein